MPTWKGRVEGSGKTERNPGLRSKILNGINIGIALFLLALSIRFFCDISGELSPENVKQALASVPARVLGTVLGLTGLNYLLVIGYDVLTARQLGLRLPRGHLPMISLISFIFNNNLGMGALTGGLFRFHFLSRLGVGTGMIGRYLLLFTWIYWLGLFALGAVVFLLGEPSATIVLPWGGQVTGFYPGLLCLAVLLVFAWLVYWKWKNPGKNRWLKPVASPEIAFFQTLISLTDWCLLGLTLYFLLPGDVAPGLIHFFPVFMLAQIGGILSHTPQGMGAFDAVILLYLRSFMGLNQAVSSLLLFRGIYFLLPLVLGIILLIGYETHWVSLRKRLHTPRASIDSSAEKTAV